MCGAPVQTLDLEGVDVAKESIVQGTVSKDGAPVGGAYVRLLDSTGEFTAEVQTSAAGAFRFFAAPGDVDPAHAAPRRLAGHGGHGRPRRGRRRERHPVAPPFSFPQHARAGETRKPRAGEWGVSRGR